MDKKKKYEPPQIIDLKVDYTQATGASRCWNGAAQGWQCMSGSGAGHQCMTGNRAGFKCSSGSSARA
jgi:hypothetical protein